MDLTIHSDGLNLDVNGSSSIQGATLSAELSEAKLNIIKAERFPSIALFASDAFNGPDVTTFISGKMAGYGRLDKDFNFATVGIGISFNIDNLYKTGKKIRQGQATVKKSQAELEATREGVNLSLTAANTEYRNSLIQMDICEQDTKRNRSHQLTHRRDGIIL